MARRIRFAALAAALSVVAVLALAPDRADAAIVMAVTDTSDRPDRNIGDGQCRTAANTCTLRAAIQEANALLGQDTITLPPGTYELENPTVNEDSPTTGDHDITDSVTIVGAGAGATFVDGGFPLQGAQIEARGIDRLFEVHPSAGSVTFRGMTIREGFSDADGGAIQNWSPGLLRVENVHVLDSYASADGGGINNGDPNDYEWTSETEPLTPIPSGRVEIVNSKLAGNSAGLGAAVNNTSNGTVSILSSEVVDNPGQMIPDPLQHIDPLDPEPIEYVPGPGVYEPTASAITNKGEFLGTGTIRIVDSDVSGNYAPTDGAGVSNLEDGNLIIERSTFTENTSEGNGGAIYIGGGRASITGTPGDPPTSLISDNLAHADGGGVYSAGHLSTVGLRSKLAIEHTTITGNEARAGSGGMLQGGDGELLISDVEITENESTEDHAGGLSIGDRASATLTRATVDDNTAYDEGGGMFTASERPIKVSNSSFSGNSAGVPGLEGNDAGGGGIYTEGGPIEITGSTISENTATGEGGGITIDNHGDVDVVDTVVNLNETLMDGGGVENSGAGVVFERVTASGNKAVEDGGGIHNSSSGEFKVLDSTIKNNKAKNGGGFTNASDSTLIFQRSLIVNNVAKRPYAIEDPEEGGLGGGFYSISDGGGKMENTTISHNSANVRGGGMFHDADASFKIANITVWRNSAPYGGGISTVESDFVPAIPPQPNPLTLTNSIVGGSVQGGACDWYITSLGGNIATDHSCFISVPGSDLTTGAVRDRQGADPQLDAIADNGGPTLTHATKRGSFAIDGAVAPCAETDARGVERPQNGKCDAGAYEFVGDPPDDDFDPPNTAYVGGPVQDSLETNAFYFTGDDVHDGEVQTKTEELIYECRVVEHELTEAPEPVSPFEPVPPELIFNSCASGWQTELFEDGLWTFEVRAIDRAGNVDPTPAQYTFNGVDLTPPDTWVEEGPPAVTSSRAATFTFGGRDNHTPAKFLEFECRLDSRDPDMWLECLNPTFFSNLTTGEHLLEVRALDGGENYDRTPFRYRWTVGQPSTCNQANVTLTPTADGWVDEVNPTENYMFETELTVNSGAVGDPGAQPPEPVTGQNARTLVRFPLNNEAANCELESATLRMYSDSNTEGRILQAKPLAGPFKESTLTWISQPGVLAGATAAETEAGEGYREWDVLDHVEAMFESGVNHGWQIRDKVENDPDGGDQSFSSRETPQDPPETTLPELKLRYVADATPPPERPVMPPGTPLTTVHCGMTITEHTRVANDLFCPEGEGLVVGKSNIVLDLNGHTIEGPDYLLENVGGQEEGFPAGIRVSGRTNVVVRNGTVQKFGWGVLLSSATTHSYVEDLALLRNAVAGVELFDADDGRNGNTIERNRIEDNELGVLIGSGSENSVVRNNQIAGNLGEQVHIFASDGHLIENNTMHGIPSDPTLDSDGGVGLEGSSDNVLRNNTIRDTGDAGVVIHMGSHRNVVEGGEFYRNGDAGVIIGDSERNKVIGITSHQQSDGGVVLGSAHHTEVKDSDLRFNPSGVEASNSNGLLIQNNDASDSLQTGFEVGNGVGIRILDNVANRTGGAGIGMEGGVFDPLGLPIGGAVIMRNETNQNGESGIAAAAGGHRIDDNEAHNNAGFGIAAEDDAISTPLSNKASGNAEPEQCTGVVCDTGMSVPLGLEDVTAPVTVIDEAPTDPSRSTSPTFRFSANDVTPDGAPHTPATGMVFECRLDPGPDPEPEPQEPDPEPPDPGQPPDPDTPPDGEGWAECVSPITFHDLDEGRHHFEVRALDQADLRDQTPAVHEWTIEPGPPPDPGPDPLPPETRIASGPANPTVSTEALFRFAGTDNATPGLDLRFECRLDTPAPGAPGFASCPTAPTQRYDNLDAGQHTFEVRAIDLKGNIDPTPAIQTWTIQVPPPDLTAPDTAIDSGPDRTTVLTNASFTFSSPDPTATFQCSLNAGAWADCASPKDYTGLTPQLHELRVRAKDPAGNVDASPASYQWRVSEAPVPTFVFCGQKLTRSTLVRNDLTDCLFDGLVVGADGITVDLGGHTIDGKGLGAAVRIDGYDHVTVKGGKAVDYDYGVALNTGTTNAVVENMTFELTQEAGVGLGQQPVQDPALPQEPPDPFPAAQSGVDDNIVRNNSFVGNGRSVYLTGGAKRNLVRGNAIQSTSAPGIWLERAHENRIEANEIGGSSGAGIGLEGAERNLVIDNHLESNNGGISIDVTSSAPAGVPSNGNRVERNRIEESGGIEVAQSHRNHLIENTVVRANESGVDLYQANDNVIRGNDLTTNKAGIDLTTSSGNHFEENDASDSESTGISSESQSFSNVFLRNTSSNNDGDGIYEGNEAPGGSGSLYEGNRTHNNKGMGIYVGKPAHIIKGNSANDNGYWGIYASDVSNGRTNVDAGGNRAMGNVGPLDPITLQPQQCHLVQCAQGPPIGGDLIPPETTILEGPPASSTDDVAVFRFSGTDNVSPVTFQCSLDGAAFAPCTSPATFEGLALGEHQLKVRAVDASGNVDGSPATHAWTVGEQPVGVPPETTIGSGPDLTTVQTSAEFEFSASERNATFQCRLDNAPFAPCAWTGAPSGALTGTTGSISYTGLSVGTHTFEVRATDLDNNTDLTPAAYSWRVTPAPVPSQVGCGEFVVNSIRVTNDLLDCPGHGLIVGAHNITIDLDGHVIDGTGIEAGIVNNGFDSVTVTNGHIHEFDYGVQLNPGTSLNVVSGLRVEMNQEAGIGLSDADQNGNGNTIRENTIVSNSWGVALFSNTRNTLIRDNDFGANQDDGIHMEGATANRVVSNEIVGSSGAGVFMQGGGDNVVSDNELLTNLAGGVTVGEELIPSNNNRVERNTIEDSGGAGVAVNDSTGTHILFNDVRGSNGPGAALDLARNSVVRGNDLRSNAGGIALSEAVGNRIELNNAGGTLGAGIALEGLSFDNDVIQNIASSNNGEGIAVSDSAPAGQGNVIERNTADSNGGDGILVDGAGHTLKENSAQLNGGWGIYAPVGANDGGGNFAAGNVEPGQCFGVVCTRGATPGAPDTWFVDKPPAVSHSRNASFTYLGRDDSTPLVDMVFECRLDSTNDLAWEDCEYPHEITNLSPGQHTLEIRALDLNQVADDTPAKYTWTYQPLPAGVAPQVTIDMKPEAASFALDALFTFHANEPDVTFECKVDLNAWEQCGFETVTHMSQGGFEWGLDETQVGPHTFYVRATDFEGNVGAPATHTWRLLGAVTQFLSGPGFTPGTEGEPATGGEVQSTTATIAFQANVANATYECSLDLEPFAPCTSPVTYTGLMPGSHELRVIATDTDTGVEEAEAAIYEWEVIDPFDSMPPETTLERAPANGSSSTIFEFAGTDDLTPPSLITFECRIDSTSELEWEPCVSPYNLLETYTYGDPQLAPGPHVFEVRANDNFEPLVPDPANPDFEGNVDPTPVRYTWTSTADTDKPGTGILAGPSGRTAETEATFEFFGTDNATPAHMMEFECSLDAGPFEPCSSPETISVEPGTHTFRVRSVDLAGNVDDLTPATRTWEVVPAPTATITSGPEGRILPGQSSPPAPSTQDRAIFAFTADQPDATFECALDGAEFEPCTSPYAAWLVEDGTHEFQVRAVSSFTTADGEPIVQEPATSYEWRAEIGPDTTRPDTQITSGPSASTLDSVATFRFTGSDNRTPTSLLTFECALDPGTAAPSWNSCTSPEQFSDLTHGPHELLVRARDVAGNFDATPARHTWSVVLPPVVTITSGPEELTDSTSANFTFTSNTPGSTFKCWLDGAMTDCTSPKSYSGLAAGDHLFAVLATSPAGHTSVQWEEYEWTIGDTQAPITTFHSGPEPVTAETRAEFTFSANKPNSTFTCSLDGGTALPCSSPLVFGRLHPGLHSLEVVASSPPLLDPQGNPVEPFYEPVPAVYEWEIVDDVAPIAAIDWGPRATTASVNAIFGLSSDDPSAIIECSLDGQGFGECDPVAEFTDLVRGPHTLRARAVDLAGNVGPVVTHSWTITDPPGPNTPVGTNVTVPLPMPDSALTGSVNFAEVSLTGYTGVESLSGGPPLPIGYTSGRFYEVGTTAEFGEPMLLCLAYDPADFPNRSIRLLQAEGAEGWIDLTTTNNPFTGQVCAAEASIGNGEAGIFALAAATHGVAPFVSIVSGPPPVSNSSAATFEFFVDQPDSFVTCSIDGLPFEPCESPKTYTHLEEGGHEFQAQAIGPFGIPTAIPTLYEWEVVLPPDNEPPDTTITKGPPAITGSFINLVEFTGSDNQTHELELEFECRVDNGAWESCEAPHEVEVLTRGTHRVEVRALDIAGNFDPTPAARDFTVVDVSVPDTSIDSGPQEETTETTATFTYSGVEENGTVVNEFECSLDGQDFVACSEQPYTVTGLTGGPHVMEVRAKDPDGNVDPTPDFYEWLVIAPVDTTPPDTIIFSGPAEGSLTGPDVTFGFIADELVSEFECSLDGGPFEACEGLHQLIGLPSGEHTIAVRALDLAEPPNVDPTPATRSWNVLGEPETQIDSHPPLETTSASGVFTFSSDQTTADGVTFECSVDGSLWVACTSPFTAGPLAAGDPESGEQHEFEVRAVSPFTTVDGEPIVDQTPASYTWTVFPQPDPPAFDTIFTSTPPAVTAGGPDVLYTFTFEARLDGQATNLATFECQLDGGAWEECEAPLEYDGLADGEHTLRVRALDPALQPDASPASFTWTIEAAPETTLSAAGLPPAETDGTTATFTFGSPSSSASFECALDTTTFTACSSPKTYTDISHGEHVFQVRAKSPAGSVDQTPEVHEWTSGDMTPPVVTIDSAPTATSGPEFTTESTTATFAFSSDDPSSQYLCTLTGAPAPVPVSHQERFCSSPVTYTDLTPGLTYTFTVEPTKPFLLVSGEPATWEWSIVDTTAPVATIEAGPTGAILPTAPAIFTFSADEPSATFECALDGADFGACESPADYSGLEAGQHTLQVRAVDLADPPNVGPAVSWTWTVIGPPTTTILNGPPVDPDTTTSRSATFEFESNQQNVTFRCSLDGADSVPCSSPYTLDNLAAGPHELEIQGTNEHGMVEEPAVTHAWTIVDGDAPETTIELGPPASTTSRTATFTFSSNEADATFECALDTPSGAEPAWNDCGQPPENTFELADLAEGAHELLVRAVDPSGNADASPASYSWTVLPVGPPNTPVGSNVTVTTQAPDAAPTATVTFGSVTATGFTSVETLSGAAPLPLGYVPAGALFYEVSTTATWNGALTVCLTYTPSSLPEPVRLLHFDGSVWVDVTTSNDPVAGRVCGEPGSLSAFAIASATSAVVPDTTILSGPPAETTSVDAGFEFDSNAAPVTYECALDTLPGAEPEFGSCEASHVIQGLLPGSHELLVRAKNEQGVVDATPARHSWTIVPLETTIVSGPDEATESTTAEFEFSSDYASATFECLLDDAVEWAPCDANTTYTGLTVEEHELLVRARTPGGAVDQTPAEWSWEIGDVPPPVTIDSDPGLTTESRSATFIFSAPEAGVTFECSLDGASFQLCATPKTYTGLALGEHTFRVQVHSPQAIVEQTPATHTWSVVDQTAPQTTIDGGPAAVTGNVEASLSFSASEQDATFECSLDGAAYAPCSSPAEYNGLTPGEYTFRVRAVDPSANADASPATHTWTVVARPETTIDIGPESEIGTTSTSFTFSSDQPGSTFECSLDGGPFLVCPSPHEVANLTDGDHTLFVRARNAQGVEDDTPAEWGWTVDAAAPQTTIATGPSQSGPTKDATFTFASNEAGVTFECSLDGAPYVECESPYVPEGLTSGQRTLSVRAIDGLGNVDQTPATYTWTYDGTAPQTTIGSGPNAPSGSTSATFEFSADEAGASFECSLDGAAFSACTSPKQYSGLAVGAHELRVRATDVAGNTDASPAVRNWSVDTTPPGSIIVDKPAATTQSGSATFTFGASEQNATFECSLDGAAFAGCSAPKEYTGLATGEHTFRVRAIDPAGNVEPEPESHTWTVQSVDSTPPTTSVNVVPEALTTEPDASFEFTSNEAGATFECSLDGAAFTPCTSPRDYTGLADGQHEFRARATDAAGNVDQTPATYTWRIDTTAPETTIGAGAPPASGSSTSATFNFSSSEQNSTFECSLDNGAFAPCTSPRAYTSLAVGVHTFRVRAADAAENVDQTPATHSWTISQACNGSTVTLGAAADSWILQDSASQNYGSDSSLKVDTKAGANARATFRFNLPAVPAGCRVTTAKLRLYAASYKTGRTLQAWRMAAPWTETGLNWSNQPATTGTAATVASGSGYREWTVTDQVLAMYAPGANHGFLIRDATENGTGLDQVFNSREKGTDNPPRLVLTFAP